MFKKDEWKTLALVTAIILFGALMRIIPHPYNLSPVGAMALLAGAYIRRPLLAILVPVLALFLSDLYLGMHSTMPYVYGAFVVSVAMGQFFLNAHKAKASMMPKLARLSGITLFSSLGFFLISNLGVWHLTLLYPKSLPGLVECYIAAIPFYPATLLGDLLYAFAFFGAAAFLVHQNREKSLSTSR